MNINACNRLQEEDLEKLNRELLAYTYSRLRPLHWNHKHEGTVKGMHANDYVQEAFRKFLSSERKWNPKTHPDIKEYLKGIISSLISNAINSKENQTSTAVTPSELDDEFKLPIFSYFPDAESKAIADDLSEKIRMEIEKIDDDTKMLSIIFDALTETPPMKRIEICKILELEDRVVSNALKRIRRLSHKVLQKHQTHVEKIRGQ